MHDEFFNLTEKLKNILRVNMVLGVLSDEEWGETAVFAGPGGLPLKC